MDTATIKEAFDRIKGRGVLVGTAALWIYGYDVNPGDVDFLVDSPQFDAKDSEPGSTSRSYRTHIGGVKVDYIFADERRVPFMTPEPCMIEGVAVAALSDVIGLKELASRLQDVEFLANWAAGRIGRRA